MSDSSTAQFDLHLRQVLGDGEQFRRGQAGGHGLAGLDRAGEHHPVHRRADHRALQVDPGGLGGGGLLADLRLRGVHLRLRLFQRRTRQVDVALADQLLAAEVGLAVVVQLRVAQACLRLPQRGLRAGDLRGALLDLCLVGRRIDRGQHLALGHAVIEIDQHFGDLARHLAAHGDRGDRAERAGRGDRHAHVAALHGLGAVAAIGRRPALAPEIPAAGRDGDDDGGDAQLAQGEGRTTTRLVHAGRGVRKGSGTRGCRRG
jgi:hypothetical protein